MIPEQRDTDFIKRSSLEYLADQCGLVVLSFHEDGGLHWVTYLDRGRWVEPVDGDMAGAIISYSFTSKPYLTFDDMLNGEIQRLKEKLS